jgi:two-component system, NtrC family, response regulator HydG
MHAHVAHVAHVAQRRLVLAAADPRHALTFQAQLQRVLQVTPPVIRLEDLPEYVSPETDGDVVLFALDPADAPSVETAVREARVQQIPVRFALVESEQVRNFRLLDHLAPYVANRLVWPAQTQELLAWSRRAPDHGTAFADPATETAAARLRRRLINQTPSLTGLVEQLCLAAEHDVTVLIEGESGTGKSTIARMIHESSARAPHRFHGIACGALTPAQLAQELYGQAPGAAEGAKIGKLAAIGEGTILLDEIDTLSQEQQANILRLLETGEYEPVGGSEPQKSRARIMAATNWSLADAVERGTFRRDLYYRLHVISLLLPPLRHRPEDIGPLVRGMVARFGTKYGKRLFGICPETLRVLEAYPWPGNIRQLENVIQQAVLSSQGNELKLHHLSPAIAARPESLASAGVPGGFGGTLRQSRESSERANILRALEKAAHSRTRAAQILGVSRVTLYKKMKKYGLISARDLRTPTREDGSHSLTGSN